MYMSRSERPKGAATVIPEVIRSLFVLLGVLYVSSASAATLVVHKKEMFQATKPYQNNNNNNN